MPGREHGDRNRVVQLLHVVLVTFLLVPASLVPSTIVVTGSDSVVADDGICSLAEAIRSANANLPSGDMPGECVAGDDQPPTGDVIQLTRNVVLTNPLPNVESDISIEGGRFTVARAPEAPDFRMFFVGEDRSLKLNETTVSGGSTSGSGGGVLVESDAFLILTNSTVSGNSAARQGGGIYGGSSGAEVKLTKSTVSENIAGVTGGGIHLHGSNELVLVDSTVSNNSALSSNDSLSWGGGIFVDRGANALLVNSTVVLNVSDRQSGLSPYLNGDIDLVNTIVAANLGGESCGTHVFDLGNNFSDDFSCPGLTIAPGVDVQVELKNNGGPTKTHALPQGSRAIDAAGDCGLDTDQRGFLRDAECDSGSYEFGGKPVLALQLLGTCPGKVAVEVSNASANSEVALAWSLEQGTEVLEVGACAGTLLDLVDPKVATVVTTGFDGAVSVAFDLPEELCSVVIQAVDRVSCGVSNAATVPGPLAGH